MAFSTNLIYNGDFSHGTDSWNGSDMEVSNGELTLTGTLSQNIYVPVSSSRTYQLTYDVKFNTIESGKSFYIALVPSDSDRYGVIPIENTNKPYGSDTDTTLAVDLISGDATATLTDGSNWSTSVRYQRIGICSNLAWGWNRAVNSYSYKSMTDNVLTLSSTYTGDTIVAGTKVSEFQSGSTYFYPHYLNNSALPTDWTTYTRTFIGGNSMRYSCQYFRFQVLGYSHNYSIRNIKIECISDIQYCNYNLTKETNLTKQGIFIAENFSDTGMPIRYIRDTVNGNSVNANSHWNEIQAFNSVGENIAWNKPLNGSLTVATDGTVDSQWKKITGSGSAVIDLGFIENIEKIKIWHYYPDGRTYYDNVTEVSQDGTNWITVYSGEKPETSAGNEIILSPWKAMIYNTGELHAQDFYEL